MEIDFKDSNEMQKAIFWMVFNINVSAGTNMKMLAKIYAHLTNRDEKVVFQEALKLNDQLTIDLQAEMIGRFESLPPQILNLLS